jgi:hypothetical protein
VALAVMVGTLGEVVIGEVVMVVTVEEPMVRVE